LNRFNDGLVEQSSLFFSEKAMVRHHLNFSCSFMEGVRMNLGRTLLLLTLFLSALPLPAEARADELRSHRPASAVPTTQEVTSLEMGKAIAREFAGGQKHYYGITLATGRYASVIVEQRGIDVVVQLLGADGKVNAEYDDEITSHGAEQINLVADADGSYKFAIAAKFKGASPGSYEIRWTEVRTATEKDRLLDQARKLRMETVRMERAGKYDEALPLAEKLLAIREQELGPEHPEVAKSLYEVAGIVATKGDYKRAELLYQRAVDIAEKALGQEHPRLALYLSYFGTLYYYSGDYVRAERLYQRALLIQERALGIEHPDLGYTLERLGYLYRTQGDFTRAEPLFQRALVLAEKTLGAEHIGVARALINFANFYREKGDYAKAEPMYQRAMRIWEKVEGTNHPNYAAALNNLANLYRDKRDFDKAESLYHRALSIKEKALGLNHPDVARYRDNLAFLYYVKGEYAKAEPLYLSALAIWEKSFEPNHPMVGRTVRNLAQLSFALKDYEKAERLYQRALSIYETAFGANYYFLASILRGLAKTATAEAKYTQAVAYLARANTIHEYNLNLNLAIGSERQKLAYLDRLGEQLHRAISLHIRFAADDPLARELAVTTVLQHKGRLQDALSNSLAALRNRFNAADQALLDQLNSVTAQLAQLVLNGPQGRTPVEYQKQIQALEEQREKLETEVSRRSAGFYQLRQPVTVDLVSAAIPDNAALVEIAVFRPIIPQTAANQEAFDEPHYAAYVVRRQGEVQWKELGPAKAIDDAVDHLRKALRNPKRKDAQQLARVVDEKVMQPVRRSLGDATQLIISPDGALNLIPFEALVDEQNRFLIERYSFSYVTSGRDLLRLQVPRPNQREPLVFADPVFGEPEAMQIVKAGARKVNQLALNRRRQSVTTGADLSNVYFAPLSGTEQEAQSIRSLFPEATVMTGMQATETWLKQTVAPRLLHIATHGFFLTDTPASSSDEEGETTRAINAKVKVENPMLRSGLALAGANLRKSGDDDGILTALEASNLNLWGTKLVTLSACDTGLGEVKNGEGVYGLRRAFVLAGTESLVMSLWPVSDYVTRELMTGYYTGLKQGQGRGEALRQIQLEMLRSKGRQHPFYWASFIQSGEWANLDGKR
jgi:CHAT domain-containing protein/Tfp pilus assembly protein PilF